MLAKEVVIDASALAAFLFAEEGGQAVVAKLGRSQMVAPSLLPYELSSVCFKKMRKEPARSEAFRAALQGYVDMPVELVDLTPLAVLQNVELFKLSAYDAAYLCLAMQRNAQLITLDADLGKAAKKLGLLA